MAFLYPGAKLMRLSDSRPIQRLYCGFESAIECFDVANPGTTGTRFHTSPSRKSKHGQKGLLPLWFSERTQVLGSDRSLLFACTTLTILRIHRFLHNATGLISSMSLCPDGSGIMAAGSYNRSVYFYDVSGGEPRMIRSIPALKKHRGSGVTQVKFHPTSPHLLYTASRCANEILVWDTRNVKQAVQVHKRRGMTNQRISFDIDVWGKWLTTGDMVGNPESGSLDYPSGRSNWLISDLRGA